MTNETQTQEDKEFNEAQKAEFRQWSDELLYGYPSFLQGILDKKPEGELNKHQQMMLEALTQEIACVNEVIAERRASETSHAV